MLKEFNTYLNGINYEFWKELCIKHGSVCCVGKGEDFITSGTIAKHIGLITQGSMKYIVYTSDGKEKVIGLETIGGFAASFPFCLHNHPSVVSVVANSDSQLYSISVATITELARTYPGIRSMLEKTLEIVFYDIYNRYVSLYALSPRERYERLLERCPQLFDIFPQKDIASYLNITPQHLRRFKSK